MKPEPDQAFRDGPHADRPSPAAQVTQAFLPPPAGDPAGGVAGDPQPYELGFCGRPAARPDNGDNFLHGGISSPPLSLWRTRRSGGQKINKKNVQRLSRAYRKSPVKGGIEAA